MKSYSDDIKESLRVLKSGGTILYPTDTVWGIGCDATNPEAVKKIIDIKKREAGKNFILLLDHESRLLSYVKEIPDQAWGLIEFSQKPLTIIYDGAKNLPPEIIAEDGSIGIRIVKDDFCRDLMFQFRKPLVSTSANIGGRPAPQIFDEIDSEIQEKVDYIVKWRREDRTVNPPSTVMHLKANGQIKFIRR